ncbi:Gfo/Idh/MocA family oxidoreductase [Embleya scabrispora]|uniref:Gfo/Idh/MocA family oxidoreductase n=1 Tax=Embleya scabrispora TaxID=159449 RepID=UPI0003A63251|nr:Gfo/Idh/MocA family oxidoreductase [Embleya scabrispora]MYS82449.1 Gfo/Idh/MocA family oxidoreductase [Streptomyces sp. SID5474]
MGPTRTVLVGYGVGGSAFHAPVIEAVDELELVAVVTGNPERGAQVRKRHPQAEVIGTTDEMFARAGDFDLVVITVPNRFHVPLATRALEAGLHVVVDKPFAGTAAEGRELVLTATRRHRGLGVYQNRRFDGDFRTVRRLVEEGRLGEVYRFESRFERWRPQVRTSGWKEQADPAALGGILYDLGTHLIDQAVALFGRPTRVYAELDTRRPGALVDDDSFVALTHASGVRSHLWMSATAADLGPRFRVLGSKASYVKFGMDPQEELLRSGADVGTPGWGTEPPAAWGVLGTPGDTVPVETEPGAYQDYYAAFARAVRGEGAPPVSFDEALTVLETIEAAQRSSADGVTVTL